MARVKLILSMIISFVFTVFVCYRWLPQRWSYRRFPYKQNDEILVSGVACAIVPKSDCQLMLPAAVSEVLAAEPKEMSQDFFCLPPATKLDLDVNHPLTLSCLSSHSYPCIGMLSSP
jgi:hypothetical protein